MESKARKIIDTYNSLKNKRSSFEDQWDECRFYCFPEGEDNDAHMVRSDGEERPKPNDGTAIHAALELASGLFSNTVAIGQEWFSLKPKDKRLASDSKAAAWCANASTTLLEMINSSNLSLVLHTLLHKYGIYGTGVLYPDLTNERFTFREYPIHSCVIAENHRGEVDTLMREFTYTAKQAVEAFGEESVTQEIAKCYRSGDEAFKEFTILHAVVPRPDGDPESADPKEFPYASIYVELGDEEVMHESGFRQFPFMVPRFYKTGSEANGRSPAMMAMYDIRMLNTVVGDYSDATEMSNRPPVWLPDSDVMEDDPEISPGAVNYFDSTTGVIPQFMQVRTDIGLVIDFAKYYVERVKKFFFVDLFRMLEDEDNMTATEVRERVNEKIQTIGPVIARLQSELFDPMVMRCLNLAIAKGAVSQPPEALLDGGGIRVGYTTRMSSKLAQIEVMNIRRTAAEATEILAYGSEFPQLGALFDLSRMARYIARANNVDPEILNSPRKEAQIIREIEEQRAEAQRQAASQGAIKPVDVSKRPEPGSPLDAMKKGET